MNRRRFLGVSGLGALAAFFAQIPSAVASTVESCVAVLEQIREIALGSGNPNEKLAQIVALIDGEIGPAATPLAGDFAGTIPAGEVWKITGDVNLTGDLIVEGTLTSVDTFTLEGNGHQILVQNGGRLNLAGKPKSGWVNWGDPVTGWEIGDTLAVAPTQHPKTGYHAWHRQNVTTWQGWDSTVRPSGRVWFNESFSSGPLAMDDGSTIEPAVANLTRTANIRNVSRIMFHMGAGVQTMRHVAIENSGVFDTLDFYSIHLHHLGDSSVGSVFEGVVIDKAENHAFVPHSSNGVTFTDCIAHDVKADAYWWNTPHSTDNTVFDHCLALGVVLSYYDRTDPEVWHQIAGFALGLGSGNRVVDCTASAVFAGQNAAGFKWPSSGSGVWDFRNNNAYAANKGIFVWQNTDRPHVIESFRAKANGSDIDHGAYTNAYRYSGLNVGVFKLRAQSWGIDAPLIVEDSTISVLAVAEHRLDTRIEPVRIDRCSVGSVIYRPEGQPSSLKFSDCGLTPAAFDLTDSHPASVISIVEGGSEVFRYENGWV